MPQERLNALRPRQEMIDDYTGALERALMDLYNNMGGHNHWDREGNSGRTCLICIRQREAQERVQELVHGIPVHLYGVPL